MIDLAELKSHLGLDPFSLDLSVDTVLQNYLNRAIQEVENRIGKTFTARTIERFFILNAPSDKIYTHFPVDTIQTLMIDEIDFSDKAEIKKDIIFLPYTVSEDSKVHLIYTTLAEEMTDLEKGVILDLTSAYVLGAGIIDKSIEKKVTLKDPQTILERLPKKVIL